MSCSTRYIATTSFSSGCYSSGVNGSTQTYSHYRTQIGSRTLHGVFISGSTPSSAGSTNTRSKGDDDIKMLQWSDAQKTCTMATNCGRLSTRCEDESATDFTEVTELWKKYRQLYCRNWNRSSYRVCLTSSDGHCTHKYIQNMSHIQCHFNTPHTTRNIPITPQKVSNRKITGTGLTCN